MLVVTSVQELTAKNITSVILHPGGWAPCRRHITSRLPELHRWSKNVFSGMVMCSK
jgi:hypothetical protein